MKSKNLDSQKSESEKTIRNNKSQPQRDRFIETARNLEVDESGQKFEEAFGKLVPTRKPNA